MALITDADAESWTSAAATTATEVWQVRSGEILLSTQANPDDMDGLWLPKNAMITIGAGVTVKYRLPTNVASASLAREEVSA